MVSSSNFEQHVKRHYIVLRFRFRSTTQKEQKLLFISRKCVKSSSEMSDRSIRYIIKLDSDGETFIPIESLVTSTGSKSEPSAIWAEMD